MEDKELNIPPATMSLFDRPFTGDDLKRLKEFLALMEHRNVSEMMSHPTIDRPYLHALIARLEAAETLANHLEDWHLSTHCDNTCSFHTYRQAWHATAGKS